MIVREKMYRTWKIVAISSIVSLFSLIIFLEYQEGTFFKENQSAKLLFLGDVMLDRDIRRFGMLDDYTSLWGNSREVFKDYDTVIFNLEGPITDNASVSRGSDINTAENTTFTFSQEILSGLPPAIDFVMHIGNNHILDFSYEGLFSTENILRTNNVKYFGDVAAPTYVPDGIALHNDLVSLVSFNEFLGDGVARTVRNIKAQKEHSLFVIVYTHWGAEYERVQPAYIKKLAHEFIDAGADLVVGTHPHVVSEIEVYKGKRIYYSLGNFIFDQYWDSSVRCGAVLSVTIAPHKEMSFRLIETLFENGRVRIGVCD